MVCTRIETDKMRWKKCSLLLCICIGVVTFTYNWKSLAYIVIEEQIVQLQSLQNSLHDFSQPLLRLKDAEPLQPNSKCRQYLKEAVMKREVHYNIYRASPRNIKDIKPSACLLTHLTAARFTMLEYLFDSWKDTISAAVYVNAKDVDDNKLYIENILHAKNRTNVLVHFVIKQGKYYPINYMRNVAQNGTNDCLFWFQLDIDFIPSVNLHQNLMTAVEGGIFQKYGENTALVVPAFEILSMKDIPSIPADKKDVLQLWNKQKILPYHQRPGTKNAHFSSDYKKWKVANESYQAKFVEGYEPYTVLNRRKAPPFISLYLQRYGNKVSYGIELNTRGFKFVVLPMDFIVHIPHTNLDTKQMYNEIGRCTSMIQQLLMTKIKKIKSSLS